MSTLRNTALALATLAALALVSFALGRYSVPAPEPEIRTDTLWLDRPLAPRDTAGAPAPTTRIIYEPVTDTVRDCITLPADLEPHGVIPPRPIVFRRGDVVLSYVSAAAGGLPHWQQDVFAIPERRWGLYVDAGALAMPGWQQVDARLSVRYRALTGFVGYGVTTEGPGLTFGARVKLFGWR